MTDAPSRPDPLAPDYGSSGTAAAGARPVAPDPTVDRFSAFDQPDGPPPPTAPKKKAGRSRGRNRSKPASSRPSPNRASTATTPSTAKTSVPLRATGGSKPPRSARRKATIAFTAVFVALVGIPMVLAIGIALVSNSSDRASVEREEREQVAYTPLTGEPSVVPSLPSTVTELRVEIQGSERIADVRLYSDTAVTRLEDTPLPFGATIPVTSNDAYVSISANDYGYRGPRAMRCTVYAGDVVLTTSVGIRSVQCNVTDSAWNTGG
ncbi:hypothetical protein [Humibacillus xanthopallidus]|uniref:hypothetical protein n=1 Tax=Humibacillus xanthopallidus TaxID=412689 RepID=UPI00384C6F50